MNFNKQMIEAAIWTFIETFLATLVPSIAVVEVGDWHGFIGPLSSAGVAALAAAFSIVKSAAIRNVGALDSVFLTGATTVENEDEELIDTDLEESE